MPSDRTTSQFDPGARAFHQFVAARDAGDDAGAKELWWALTELHHDRVRTIVRAFKYDSQWKLPVSDADDAIQESLLRMVDMGRGFRESLYPQFLAALKTCVRHAVMDYIRRLAARDKHAAGSLDEPLPGAAEDTGARRFDHRPELRVEDESVEDRLEYEEDLRRLHARIERLENENHRRVIHRTLKGHSSREIARELGEKVNTVDQWRRRAILKLQEMDDEPDD